MSARLDTRNLSTPLCLPSGHLQTIVPVLLKHKKINAYKRTRVSTPDSDFFDIDWAGDVSTITTAKQKGLILFHGLEGSSMSHYAIKIANFFRARGWFVALPHFRGCSGEDNLLPRSYHSGDADDIHLMVEHITSQHQNIDWYAAGVSLGGNALLKYIANNATHALHAVAAISAPLDLMAAGQALDKGLNHLLYTRMFLRTLKVKALRKARYYPGFFNVAQIASAKTLYEFDNAYTAPVHGYADTYDYWSKASSKPDLQQIRIPCLILNARNDPFLPADALPSPEQASDTVLLHQPEAGGHVGFSTGHFFPNQHPWLANRLLRFFVSQE